PPRSGFRLPPPAEDRHVPDGAGGCPPRWRPRANSRLDMSKVSPPNRGALFGWQNNREALAECAHEVSAVVVGMVEDHAKRLVEGECRWRAGYTDVGRGSCQLSMYRTA